MASSVLPVNAAEIGVEIGKLVQERGIESLTSKVIRKHLEAKFNCSLSDHKAQIDQITVEQINKQSTKKDEVKESDDGSASESSSDDEVIDREVKPKAKSKAKKSVPATLASDDDLMSSVKRRRSCVTARQKREPVPKKRKTDPNKPNNRKGKSAFSRICVLSDDLTNIIGKRYMKRADVVKAMWAYFREHDLMDPKDRRMVILDEPLKTIFNGKRIQAFGMMKGLKNHIKDAEFLDEETRKQAERDLEATNNVPSGSNVKEEEKANEDSENGKDNNSSDQDSASPEPEGNSATNMPYMANGEQSIKQESDSSGSSDSSSSSDSD
ncbi:SWIB/MDM2 domain-containing protein [Ditylenchus destructor]|uniref:SWIB/MDM2 domain-containing protein n=1 Tax=Ditylenchus destructor TaxID=166010 RepID=A0AAD4NAY6_9BILA|nr:SWIB/MDM2 domain-containing protein [Ditylenchus destructor]